MDSKMKKKFLKDLQAYNNIVANTKQQILDEFCTETAISPFQYMEIKKITNVDLLKYMDEVARDTIKMNFKIMAENKEHKGNITDFTGSLMMVFGKVTDKIFENDIDLIKLSRIAEILFDIKINEKSTDRKEVEKSIEKIADAKVMICEEFMSALARRLEGLEMTV